MFNDPSGETIEPITLAIILSVAIIGAAAIFGDWEGASAASNTPKSSPPTPGSQNNSEMASSISSGQSRDSGGSAGSRGGFEGVQTPIQPPFSRIPLPEASVATFANISSSNSGVYGVSQTGKPEPVSFLDGAPKQDFSGFWGKAKYLFTGGNVDGYQYNMDGEVLGLSPKMGVPDVGIGRLGSLAKLAKQVIRGRNGASSAYDGVRAASSYLQKAGVPRVYRKQILQSFDVGSISLRTAGNSTHGLRFYGGAAGAKGRYLFPTFTNYTTRTGLALPNKWNSMSGLRQFQIRPGSTYIYGRAASQGGIYSGGSYQMYINNLSNLIP